MPCGHRPLVLLSGMCECPVAICYLHVWTDKILNHLPNKIIFLYDPIGSCCFFFPGCQQFLHTHAVFSTLLNTWAIWLHGSLFLSVPLALWYSVPSTIATLIFLISQLHFCPQIVYHLLLCVSLLATQKVFQSSKLVYSQLFTDVAKYLRKTTKWKRFLEFLVSEILVHDHCILSL